MYLVILISVWADCPPIPSNTGLDAKLLKKFLLSPTKCNKINISPGPGKNIVGNLTYNIIVYQDLYKFVESHKILSIC